MGASVVHKSDANITIERLHDQLREAAPSDRHVDARTYSTDQWESRQLMVEFSLHEGCVTKARISGGNLLEFLRSAKTITRRDTEI